MAAPERWKWRMISLHVGTISAAPATCRPRGGGAPATNEVCISTTSSVSDRPTCRSFCSTRRRSAACPGPPPPNTRCSRSVSSLSVMRSLARNHRASSSTSREPRISGSADARPKATDSTFRVRPVMGAAGSEARSGSRFSPSHLSYWASRWRARGGKKGASRSSCRTTCGCVVYRGVVSVVWGGGGVGRR